MENILDKRCRENQNTYFIFENRAVYEIISKNMVEPEGPQMMSQHDAYELHPG
jgi:hypothetical protein